MTIIGKSLLHLSKPFTRRIMTRNYSVFLKNRLRCEKWTEVKRNCLVRSCYTKTPNNQPDKDPTKKSIPQKEKYKEYMDTVGDRKGLVNKSTNFGRILPIGLLNDLKNSTKILIIPINCEQDQTFLEKPETVDAIKIIRKHFKEIETFAEYSKPYITVMRNPELTSPNNMFQAVPMNAEAVMTAAITDFTSGKPGSSKQINKDLEEVLKGISKGNPKVKQIEVNEFDVTAEHESILGNLTKSSEQLSHKVYQVKEEKPAEKEVPIENLPVTNQELTLEQSATKPEDIIANIAEPVKAESKAPADIEGSQKNTVNEPIEEIPVQETVAMEPLKPLKEPTSEGEAPANLETTSATPNQIEQTPPSVVKSTETSEETSPKLQDSINIEQTPPIEQTSATADQTPSSNVQSSSKNEEAEEAAVSAHSSVQETEEGYINPYPETELEIEPKPSITSITFDFETDLVAREEMAKEEILSEEVKTVTMNMSTMDMAAPEKEKDKQWIPINFSAVITGSVKMPPEKLPNDQVTNMEPEQLNKLIGDILANLGEGAFHPKDALIRRPKHDLTSSFMVAPQVRDEYPYSDGKHLMDAAVYKRAVEETKKIKQDMSGGPLLVEMKSASDSCKVCTSKGTTCATKKASSSSSSCGENPPKKDGPKKLASAGKCGGQEKPEPPACKKSEEKLRKGCEGSAPKGSSSCGAKLKPSKPCSPKPNPECKAEKKGECDNQKAAERCKSEGSCGQQKPCGGKKETTSCGQPAPGSLCAQKSSDSKCSGGTSDSKDSPCGNSKKESPCGQEKPKTNPSCGKKDDSKKGPSPCSGCDKKDKWDMSYTKLLSPVKELDRIRIFKQFMPPCLESLRWFRGSIIRHWNREEKLILNQRLCVKGRRIMDIKEEQINISEIGEGDVVVKVDTVALTGSDLFLFETGNTLLSLGHGSSGVVTRVGSHVTSLEVNDRVAIEPAVPCGSCSKCLGGLYNVCPNIVFKGALSRYCVHPALFCHKLPESVALEDASLLNTLATGYQACVKAKISAKSNLIVIGSCPLALSTVMCARAMGAAKIIVASAIHTNTRLAEEIGGADGVINLSEVKNEIEVLQEIMSMLPLVDVVIDCSGCSQSINVATKALKPQGRCILAGCQSEKAQLNIFEAQLKEVMLIPSLWSCNKFPAAIKLLESNRAPLSELITHRFGFMESQIAFEKSIQRGDHDVIQAVVKCQKDYS